MRLRSSDLSQSLNANRSNGLRWGTAGQHGNKSAWRSRLYRFVWERHFEHAVTYKLLTSRLAGLGGGVRASVQFGLLADHTGHLPAFCYCSLSMLAFLPGTCCCSLQTARTPGLQSCKVGELQRCRIARLQGFRLVGFKAAFRDPETRVTWPTHGK